MGFSQESAETFGLQAVAWLAANDELLPVFMGSTGVSEDDFRAGLQDPAFQGSVLDFILMDDAWVVSFCDEIGRPYTAVAEARMALPGGGQVHWT